MTTPDSWEDQQQELTNGVKNLSVEPDLKFNPNASEFVPSWLSPTSAEAPAAPAPVVAAKPAPSPVKSEPVVDSKPSSTASSAPSSPPKSVKKSEPVAEAPESNLKKDKSVDDFAVPENLKEHLNIIFIGHVDAGKSTMGGQLLFLTGMVDKRTMEKYEREAKDAGRESWYLSWALDLNQEERAKGKTVECGRAYFETDKRRFTILDAPGHKNYVPSMIGGAAQADVAVLVISARRGEFETGFDRGGQTREHAMLVKTAGVRKIIVAINKMDESTVGWSQERFDECVGKLNPFLKQVGYATKDIDIVPISGYTGANMKDRLDPAVCPWYTGPSLIELLDHMKLPDRKIDGALMIPIADKFREMGIMISGKLESGKVKKGQNVMILPNKKSTQVLDIFVEDQELNVAIAGDNVRMRLKNVEEDDVMPGFVICSMNNPIPCVSAFEAQLAIIEYKSIMCSGYTAVLHAHTIVEEVTLASLLHMIDKKTGKKSKNPPKFLRQGDSAIVRIEVTSGQSICIETYQNLQQLGRFTLRDEGKTIAIGKVTKLITE